MKKTSILTFSLCGLLMLSGCGLNNTTKDALIGGGGGAVLGGIVGNIIGKNSKSTAIGAAIGTAIGAGAGAIIGNKMDKKKAQIESAVENVEVETVTDNNGLTALKCTFASGLMFATNSSTLTAASKSDLLAFAKELAADQSMSVDVIGHTDATGTDAINQPLSEKRALAVANYLKTNGVGTKQIINIAGKGSSEPIEDAVKSEKNRRVEVYLYASEEMVEAANSGKSI